MRLLTIFLFAMIFRANGQTIINYQTWTGASGWNIFSSSTGVPATLNGNAITIPHRSNIRQPQKQKPIKQ